MSEDVLLQFLENGLINVAGDDTKLEKLQQAAKDLAETLKKHPRRAVSFALIAFDPEAPTDDPVVVEALATLQKRWTTYRNTFSGTPVAVVRAMLLDALSKAAAEDDRVGVSFVSSARNALPFIEAGNEREIWSRLVTAIEKRVDARAEAEWATPSTIDIGEMSYIVPELKKPQVSVTRVTRSDLVTQVRAAAGPHFYNREQAGSATTSGNPHFPSGNAQWVTEFGDRLAAAIADVVDEAVCSVAVAQADLAAPFQALAQAVSGYVDRSQKAVSAATAGLQRRADLLWWKEARFSRSARMSYRDMPVSVAAAQMAFDLHTQVPTFSPASVSAFLHEAVLDLPENGADREYELRDLVNEAQTAGSLESLRTASASLIGAPEGRGPVLALISHPDAAMSRAQGEFRRLTGIPADAKLTAAAWAALLFRELQAARAAFDGASPKRRGRKR